MRELRNTVERCVILADGPILNCEPDNLSAEENAANSAVNFSERDFLSLEELEHEYIQHVLKCHNGKKTRAAQILGIDKTTLWRKLRRNEDDPETV